MHWSGLFELNFFLIGLLPTDLDEFNISSDCMKPHSDQDHKKMLELNKRAYLDPDQFDDCEELKIQLETMWKVGRRGWAKYCS